MAVIPANNNTGLYNTTGVPAVTGNDITVSGNVNANNFNATSQVNAGTNVTAQGNISAGGYFIGDGSFLTNIDAGNIVGGYGNANVAAFLASGSDSSNIVTTGNISGTYILGNGSQLTGLPATYGNANVAAFLPTYTGNLAGGNGAITNDLVVGGTIYGTFSGNISGNLVVPGANTEVIYNNNGNAGASANFKFNSATSVLNVTGNVTATQFNGSAAGLTNIPGANVTGTVPLATAATTAGTVTTAAQPNITSVGTLSSLTTSGNIDVGGSLNTDDVTSTGNVTIYGNQVITGNLTVQGNTTTINSNVITTNDKTITVANNQSTGANVDGAGLEAGNPAVATWLYNDATVTWKSSIGISAVGNITGSYILGNGSQLTGLPATYGNANVAAYLPTYTGNIGEVIDFAGGNIQTSADYVGMFANSIQVEANNGDVSLYAYNGNVSIQTPTVDIIGNTTQTGRITATGNIQGANLIATANVITSGIKTDGYYYANGTPVSFGSTYGDSNVNTHLAAFGSNTISTTGNITAGYFLGNGSQLTGIATGNYSNSNVAAYLPTYSGNIASVGTPLTYLFANNIQATSISSPGDTVSIEGITSSGTISAVGNISTGTYFIGNGSQLTGISTSLQGNLTGNINTDSYYIQNPGGVVNMGNIRIYGSAGLATDSISAPSGDFVTIEGVTATNGVQTTANISAGYYIGNGSLLTGIATGLAGNLTGNINTGSYYITHPGGEVLMGNVWVTGTLAANTISSPAGDYVQIEGITVTNGMNSSGNVQGANLIANVGVFTGTLAATNLVANTQIGNLLFLNQQIQTTQASNVALTTGILPNQGRIVVGSGYNGNISPAYDITNAGRGARFLVSDTVGITDANSVIRGTAVQNFYTLNANITSTASRINSAGTYLQIGGGSAANTMSGSIFNLTASIDSLVIGGGTSGNLTGLGNTTIQYGVSDASLITVSAGSTGGNVFGKFSQLSIAGTANTVVFAGAQFAGTGTYSGNAFVYYNPSNTNNIGLSHSNTARNATNYYAFYNDDDVAQMKLGSVRQFHEYQYALSSSAGALTVSKTNGQVQFLSVSEAITSVTFSNFVTSASTGSTTKYQTDTVTLIVQQDGTGRSITMPTPSSTYKYAGGITTIPTTASSVSMVSITALYNTVNAAVQYLITISPEFN